MAINSASNSLLTPESTNPTSSSLTSNVVSSGNSYQIPGSPVPWSMQPLNRRTFTLLPTTELPDLGAHTLFSILAHTYSSLFFFNWKVTALQCIVAFCHTTWVSRKYTYGPFLLNLPPTPFQTSFKGTLWAPCWAPNLSHSGIHDKAGRGQGLTDLTRKDRKKCIVNYLHGWRKEEKGFPVKLSSCLIFTNEDFSCRGASEPYER